MKNEYVAINLVNQILGNLRFQLYLHIIIIYWSSSCLYTSGVQSMQTNRPWAHLHWGFLCRKKMLSIHRFHFSPFNALLFRLEREKKLNHFFLNIAKNRFLWEGGRNRFFMVVQKWNLWDNEIQASPKDTWQINFYHFSIVYMWM